MGEFTEQGCRSTHVESDPKSEYEPSPHVLTPALRTGLKGGTDSGQDLADYDSPLASTMPTAIVRRVHRSVGNFDSGMADLQYVRDMRCRN